MIKNKMLPLPCLYFIYDKFLLRMRWLIIEFIKTSSEIIYKVKMSNRSLTLDSATSHLIVQHLKFNRVFHSLLCDSKFELMSLLCFFNLFLIKEVI